MSLSKRYAFAITGRGLVCVEEGNLNRTVGMVLQRGRMTKVYLSCTRRERKVARLATAHVTCIPGRNDLERRSIFFFCIDQSGVLI
ncbi:hypothetical protein MRB53_035406 [Persea americana]|uniref:Uncharacterized protein n=1 Tax=Persea americana TaxID=3435 RepID=A0ACC2K4W3_PERAE|nr:hypothetical protein MRB53_035406 [Persea americana]